jgi:hypothetical protein
MPSIRSLPPIETGAADPEIAAGLANVPRLGCMLKNASFALDLPAILFHETHPFSFRSRRRVSRKLLHFYKLQSRLHRAGLKVAEEIGDLRRTVTDLTNQIARKK